MPAVEILPLLFCSDGFLVLRIGSLVGRAVRRLSRPYPVARAFRRPAFSPAERFRPCRRLSLGIPRN